MTPINPKAAFQEAARRYDLNIPDVTADGNIHRFSVDPNKPGDKTGWYVFHGDGIPSGAFGCWRSGLSEKWCSMSDRDMTPDQRNEHQRRVEQAKAASAAELEKDRTACRERSTKLWDASPEAAPDHPYLLKKLIGAHNIRQNGDNLIVPVRGIDGTLHGLQKIDPTGRKLFEGGTRKQTSMHIIGFPNQTDHLLVCEGYATGASLYEAMKLPTVIAFDCGNLGLVASAIRQAYPNHKITICADDDHLASGNPGRTSAEEAARAIGGTVAVPAFPANRGGKDTDFNDLFRLVGTEEVKRQVDAAVTPPPFVHAPVDQAEVDHVRERGKGSTTTTEATPPNQKQKSLFGTYESLVANAPPLSWYVKRRIERETFGMIVAASGAGKSFVAIDLALAGIFGRTWAGMPVHSNGIVVIVAGEGKCGLLRRVQAYEKHHGVKVPEGRLLISHQRIELDGTGGRAIEEELAAVSEASGLPIDVVIVDTLARALPEGTDENKASDVSPLINVVDRLRDRFSAIAILVHHTGVEGSRSRGTTSLPAAADFILSIRKSGFARTLNYTKLKDGEIPPSIDFALVSIPLGVDEDGDVFSSAVVEWQGISSNTPVPTQNEIIGLESLRATIASMNRSKVTAEEWRPNFYERHIADSHNAKKVAFQRIRKNLASKGLVAVKDEVYHLPDASR